MGFLEKLRNAWQDSELEWQILQGLDEEHQDISEDSLADLAGDLGAHDPRAVAGYVRRTMDRGLAEEEFYENATPLQAMKHWLGF